MSVVTPEIIKQVAKLARLHVEGEQLSQLASQLDEILQYVQQLQSVSTEGIQPTSHAVTLTNVQRTDTPQPSLSQELVMKLAPAAHPPFITVPKVLAG